MREPVELHDINTLDETMTTPRTVRDNPTKDVNEVDASKHEPAAAASRKLQIFCVVLLLLLVISSVTLGVFIHKLVSYNRPITLTKSAFLYTYDSCKCETLRRNCP